MNFGIEILAGAMAAMTLEVAPPEPRRLSEQQVEQVLAEAAARREASEQVPPRQPRQVQGELGVSVGTGDFRGAFGTATIPLGDESGATLSFSTEKGRGGYSGGYDERGPSGLVPR